MLLLLCQFTNLGAYCRLFSAPCQCAVFTSNSLGLLTLTTNGSSLLLLISALWKTYSHMNFLPTYPLNNKIKTTTKLKQYISSVLAIF